MKRGRIIPLARPATVSSTIFRVFSPLENWLKGSLFFCSRPGIFSISGSTMSTNMINALTWGKGDILDT
jgi:hypothetical protein